MPRASSAAMTGLALAAALVVLAAYFAIRQWLDRRDRGPDLAAADADYLRRQDRRRWLGSAVMVLLAAGIAFGSWINPRASRAAGRLFGATWLGVITLLSAWLTLAILDWRATQVYARRRLKELIGQRGAALEDYRRRRAARDHDRLDGPNGQGPSRG